MRLKYNKIFFDLDGTLSDSYNGIENGIKFALKKTGIKEISENEIRMLMGIPIAESLKRYYCNSTAKTAKAVGYFREYYREKGIKESELYPGIVELLEFLSFFSKLYVVTAKPTLYAKRMLEHHKIAGFFTKIMGCNPNGRSGKKSDLLKKFSNLKSAIMIGDNMHDIEAGKTVGINTCGVLYGYGSESEIENSDPDFMVSSVSELKMLLI